MEYNGCLMLYLQKDLINEIQSKISKEDYKVDQDRGYCISGKEENPHITLLYGLNNEYTMEDFQDILPESFPQIGIGNIDAFRQDEQDVLILKPLDNTQLLKSINKQLTDNYDYENNYPDYTPHITIAYLEKGCADKYIKQFKTYTTMATPTEFVYDGQDGEQTISLPKQVKESSMKHIKEATYNLSKLFRNLLRKDQALFDFEAFDQYLADTFFDEKYEMPSQSLFTDEGLAQLGAKNVANIEKSMIAALNNMRHYRYRLTNKRSDELLDMLSDYFDKVGGEVTIEEASYNLSKLFRNILGKDQELFDFEAFQEYLNDSKFDEEFEMPSESLFTVEGLANIGAREAYDIEESIVLALNDMHNYGYRLADKSSDQVVDMLSDYFDRVGGEIPIVESYEYDDVKEFCESLQDSLREKFGEFWLIDYKWSQSSVGSNSSYWTIIPDEFEIDKSKKPNKPNFEDLENLGTAMKISDHFNKGAENLNINLNSLPDLSENTVNKLTDKIYEIVMNDTYEENYHYVMLESNKKIKESHLTKDKIRELNTISKQEEKELYDEYSKILTDKHPSDREVNRHMQDFESDLFMKYHGDEYNYLLKHDHITGVMFNEKMHILYDEYRGSIVNELTDGKIYESTNKKGKNMKKFSKPLKESALEDLKFDVNVRVYKRSNYLDEHLTGTYDEVYNEFRAIKGDKKINSISIEGKRFPELESIFDDYILRDMLEASDSFNDFDRLVNKWRKEGKPNQFSKLIKESRLRKLLEDEEEIEVEDESAYIPEEEPIIQRVSNNDEFELISAGDMDEPINELPVYDVMAQDLSDKPFYLVIDNDGDEDDGVIITVPENDDEGASLEAAMEIVQKIVDNIPTEIVMEEDENGDEVEKEVEVPVEIIENDDNSVTIKGDLDKILDAIVGEVGREEIMADISTGKDVDVEVTSIVEESLVQKRINLVRNAR